MNKFALIFGIVIFLSFYNVNSAEDSSKDDSLNVFSATVVEQSPPVVPAIALEQRANARVKLFLSVSPIAIGNVEYIIDDVFVRLYKTDQSGFINSIKENKLLNTEDMEYDNYQNPFDETLAVVDVNLGRIRTGRSVRIVEDETAEKICSGELNDSKSISDLIPDELNVSMKVGIKFRACKDGDGNFKETGKCTGILLSQRDYNAPEDIAYSENELLKCYDRAERMYPSKDKAEDLVKEKKRCDDIWRGRSSVLNYIVDYDYVDTTIGIDKTNLDRLVGPEELKKQICRTLEWREGLGKVINKTEKARNFFESTCLVSVLGGAFNILRGDSCDALDSISLGCDWIFCPGDKECNGHNPMNSIVTATTMCWDYKKPFFGKSLGYNVIVGKTGKNNDVNIIKTKYLGEDTKLPEKGNDIGEYTSPVCNYKPGDSPKLRFPHYACVTGVQSNLEIIDNMIGEYQECLIQARLGGVSVGWCDKLRSYFLCDRVLGEALEFTGQAGAQGLLGKFFSYAIGKPLDLIIPGESKTFFSNKKKAASDLADLSIARYQNVPFIQLLGKEKQFIKNEVCNAFISGNLFSLEDMKQSLNLLDVDYPDSAFVITEKRPWSQYKSSDGSLVVSEYSYDVFYQIYNGEKSAYAGNGYYTVYLRDLTSSVPNLKERCERKSSIVVDSGYVKKGQMVQENVFKTDSCEAREQCLRFKGKFVCSPIGQILSFASTSPYDPFGFSIFDKNDADNDKFNDNWELKYFGLKGIVSYDPEGKIDPDGDVDGDGYCNAEEYLAVTDPTSKLLHPTTEPDCDSALDKLKGDDDGSDSQTNEKEALDESDLIDTGLCPDDGDKASVRSGDGSEYIAGCDDLIDGLIDDDVCDPDSGAVVNPDSLISPILPDSVEDAKDSCVADSSVCKEEGYDVVIQSEDGKDYIAKCDDIERGVIGETICDPDSGAVFNPESSNVVIKEDSWSVAEKECEDIVKDINSCDDSCLSSSCVCKAYGCNLAFGSTIGKDESCGGKRDAEFGDSTTNYKYGDFPQTSQPYQDKIARLADKYGVPRLLALSLVARETGIKHCCKEASRTQSDCNPDYNSNTCSDDPDLIIKSYDFSSLGIMQINKNVHSDCYDKSLNSERSSGSICNVQECNGETARNVDCNIAAGMKLLKQGYNLYGKGCKLSSTYIKVQKGDLKRSDYNLFMSACETCTSLDGFNYYNYGGWDAALRSYNGWACRDNYERNYVEDVRVNVGQFKG